MPDLDWAYQSLGREPLRENRFPLMRPVRYERTEALSEAGGLEGHHGMALSINVSSGGMCLLMDVAPQRQEVLRVHVPMPIAMIKTPIHRRSEIRDRQFIAGSICPAGN